MAPSRYEPEEDIVQECANCGEVGDLLRCSRCRTEYFCSLKCHKAYWPFHREFCRKNEFADCVEEREPRFAAWMRSHGKMAVLRDDEVERLERAARAAAPPLPRQHIMDSMYGRLQPKPKEPSFSPDEQARMKALQDRERTQALLQSPQERQWQQLGVSPPLGLECRRYKWRQNQSRVEVYAKLPQGCEGRQVQVRLGRRELRVVVLDEVLLEGALWADVQLDDSTWTIDDGVLEISLLKARRRGHYAPGQCNADTFWRSVLTGAPDDETLQLAYPPSCYYWSALDPEDSPALLQLPASAAGAHNRPSTETTEAVAPRLLQAP